MTVTLLPFAEQVTIAWLKANTDLLALHGGRVGTNLNATLPAVRVSRVGGTPPEMWEDAPSIQIECWAATQIAAWTLTSTALAALPTIRGPITGGRIYTYQVTSGPFWAPDDPSLSSNARYIFTVVFVVTL